ncbi:MAG: tRNA preQ1(34) S-adenosylmethionine ribosyltransferase-isomerase QueA [Candidatus Eisenbacteria bacterium]|nr:tRNA preQ1(34) S-adenosylmethionine ribosyltransferase-isomerase QueA [Candidatus Eisenbacteria bacterium]
MSNNELAAFEFELPESFIAKRPAVPRSSSRLMVLDRAALSIEHSVFESFPSRLEEGDCLVLNETKVRPCRMSGVRKETGGKLELLFVRENEGTGDERPRWEALVRPARRLKDGTAVSLSGGASARIVEKLSGASFLVEVPEQFEDYLEKHGQMPIPPYIRRKADADDKEHYQTVYARVAGSSAAPTAGLHFTREILRKLEARGVGIATLTLHVGPGTFRPLTPGTLSSQKLDPESYEITAEACQIINRTRGRGGRVFAVGTTSARVLETVANSAGGARGEALGPAKGWTDRFIYPPYDFKSVDALITNFHLPGSSVLLLVCAFAGREFILKAYEEAKREGYRFYSYGDGMLIV